LREKKKKILQEPGHVYAPMKRKKNTSREVFVVLEFVRVKLINKCVSFLFVEK